MAEKIVMGYWDCPYCDSKGIPGTTYDCPNCGRQRGKETKFYMKSGKVDYVPGHKVVGADWYCEYCGALNKAGRDTCENCGSRKDDSKDDYFSIGKKEEEKKKKEEQQRREDFHPTTTVSHSNNKKKFRLNLWFKLILAALVFMGFMMLVTWIQQAAAPKDCTFEIQKLTWENNIDIEENRTFLESGWSMPSNGRLLYTNEEVRSYNPVLDHYEPVTKTRQVQSGGHYDYNYVDNGDGTFTQQSTFVPEYTTEYYTEDEPVYVQVPVYDTKYYYEVDKWVHDRTETTSGDDKNPVWPEVNLSENQRIENRSSRYAMEGTLRYKSFWSYKKKNTSFEIREEWWKKVDKGQTVSVTISDDRITGLETLK